MENISLRVLFLKDSPRDAEIIRDLLVEAEYELSMDCVKNEKEIDSFLRSRPYDLILSDFGLPGFDAFGALKLSADIRPEVPFICVSGSISEETAIELLKRGAVDYVLKDRPARLPLTVKRALDEVKEKKSRREAEDALRESEGSFRMLFKSSMDGILLTSPGGEFSRQIPMPAKC